MTTEVVQEYVEGWAQAAKLLGITDETARRRAAAGKFPKPCRVEHIVREGGKTHDKPTFRIADLRAYAEGRYPEK